MISLLWHMSQAQNWHEQYTLICPIKKDRFDENPNIPCAFVKFLHFSAAGYATIFRLPLLQRSRGLFRRMRLSAFFQMIGNAENVSFQVAFSADGGGSAGYAPRCKAIFPGGRPA